MTQVIDINKVLFGRTKAEKKLGFIKKLTDEEIRLNIKAETILRIYNECKEKGRDRFYIKSERRAGNDWNSNIEFIYEYKGNPYICLYVQSYDTDSSTCVSFKDFNRNPTYNGYCENLRKSFTYDFNNIAKTIRCILNEYIYYKYIEKDEREKADIKKSVSNYKILNPVYDYFYNRLGLSNLPFSYMQTTWNGKAYYKGKEGVENYIEEHYMELKGKSDDELKEVYKEVFRKAGDC